MEPGDDSAAGWRLHVLGGVPWLERGAERVVPDRRTAALLALLACEGPMTRERAAALLWPDRSTDRARANLRQLLYRLRADADVLVDAPLALRGDVQVDVDLVAGEPSVLVGPIEPMRGHDLAGMDEVEERMNAAGGRLHARIRADLAAVATEREQRGDLPAATDAARALAALDPLDEAAARLTMRLLLASGEPAAALATFARTRETLQAEIGVGPAPETVALAERAASAASAPLGRRGMLGSDPVLGAPAARRAEAGGWLAEGAALLRAVVHGLEPGPEQGRVLVQLAWLEHQLGRHEDARTAAEAGMSLLASDADGGARIEAWFVLGSIERTRGDPDAAADRWARALDLAEQRAGGAESLALRVNLGMVEDGLGRTDAALAHYLEALPIAERQGDVATTIVLWIDIGHALLDRGDTERARPLLLRAVQRAGDAAETRLHAFALDGLAACELARGDAPRAQSMAGHALAVARELGDPALQVQAAATFADAAYALGEATLARSTARAALAVAQRHGDRPGTMRAALALARASGPDAPGTRAAVVHMAEDPRAAPEIRTAARRLAAAWGVATEAHPEDAMPVPASVAERGPDGGAHEGRAGAAGAWQALVAELMTPA